MRASATGIAWNVAIGVAAVLLLFALALLVGYRRHASQVPCYPKKTLSGGEVCCPQGSSCD